MKKRIYTTYELLPEWFYNEEDIDAIQQNEGFVRWLGNGDGYIMKEYEEII